MLERLEQINNKYEEINAKLATPEVIQDIKRATELSKEARNLEDIVKAYKEYKTIIDGIKDAKEMSNDPELGEFAKEEVSNLEKQKEELEKKIQILLIPKDPNDDKNVFRIFNEVSLSTKTILLVLMCSPQLRAHYKIRNA